MGCINKLGLDSKKFTCSQTPEIRLLPRTREPDLDSEPAHTTHFSDFKITYEQAALADKLIYEPNFTSCETESPSGSSSSVNRSKILWTLLRFLKP